MVLNINSVKRLKKSGIDIEQFYLNTEMESYRVYCCEK